MAAGLGAKQMNSRIRYRLQKIAYELEQKGVRTVYRKFQAAGWFAFIVALMTWDKWGQ